MAMMQDRSATINPRIENILKAMKNSEDIINKLEKDTKELTEAKQEA